MRYYPKCTGERIYLSPMNPDDAETYVRWLNDPGVTDGIGSTSRVQSVEGEREWLKQNAGEYQFAIVRKADDTLLGNCGIQALDLRSRCAEVGLFIGEEENRSKGYGTEALRLLLGYAFSELNLHNVMLKLFSFNERALACYQKAGFREFGRRRECYFCRGKLHDQIYMELLETDWNP